MYVIKKEVPDSNLKVYISDLEYEQLRVYEQPFYEPYIRTEPRPESNYQPKKV